MVDVAGIAAFIMETTKNPQGNNHKLYCRRLFLCQLDCSLVDNQLKKCCQDPLAVQQGVRLGIQNAASSVTRTTTIA